MQNLEQPTVGAVIAELRMPDSPGRLWRQLDGAVHDLELVPRAAHFPGSPGNAHDVVGIRDDWRCQRKLAHRQNVTANQAFYFKDTIDPARMGGNDAVHRDINVFRGRIRLE